MFGLAPRLGLGWRGEKTAGDHAPLAENPGTVGKGLKMGNDTYIVYTHTSIYIVYIYIVYTYIYSIYIYTIYILILYGLIWF